MVNPNIEGCHARVTGENISGSARLTVTCKGAECAFEQLKNLKFPVIVKIEGDCKAGKTIQYETPASQG